VGRGVGANEQQGGRFVRGSSAIYYQDGFGLRCTMSETIGHRWRCSGAALCAKCRGLLSFVGGCVTRSKHGRVQSGHDRIQVRPGRYGAP
jgi:hypothetical protein